jgi:hypothetical protein
VFRKSSLSDAQNVALSGSDVFVTLSINESKRNLSQEEIISFAFVKREAISVRTLDDS